MKDLQSDFERFLGGPNARGFTLPTLDATFGQKLLARAQNLRWHLNRYALELNFNHGSLAVKDFVRLARDWGFDGAQLHVARGGPRMGLTAESDAWLAELAEQVGERRLDLTLDVSTLERADLNDASRVAQAMGIGTVRCYVANAGTIGAIIERSVEQLKYAADLGARRNIVFLLEQHERLQGAEIAEIIERVDAKQQIGALFDFANPLPAGRHPLEDLYVLREHIRGAHSKDVIIIPERGGLGQLGVKFGEGDLPLAKLYLDLLLLGDDEAQVEFIAVQEVVGYRAGPERLRTAADDRAFPQKSPSHTHLADDLSPAQLQKRLARERQAVIDHLEKAKLLVQQLCCFAVEAICGEEVPPSVEDVSPEARIGRAVEAIGEQLFSETNKKQIWAAIATPEDSTRSADDRELLKRARALHDELHSGRI